MERKTEVGEREDSNYKSHIDTFCNGSVKNVKAILEFSVILRQFSETSLAYPLPTSENTASKYLGISIYVLFCVTFLIYFY